MKDEEVVVLIVFGAIILICIYVWLIVKMIDVVVEKGHEEKVNTIRWMFFWASITGLGLLPFLYVLALPDLKVQKLNERMVNLLENNTNDNNSSIIQDDELPEL